MTRLWSHLTEEHEHAHVELQQSGDAERPSLCAAQRIEQQLSAQCALPLLGPHVNLLLAVGKRTVLPILALLTLLHLCRTEEVYVIIQFSQYFKSIWLYFQNRFYHLQQIFNCCISNVYIPLQSTNAPRKLFRAGRGRILFQVGSSVFLRRHSSTSLLQRCAASG